MGFVVDLAVNVLLAVPLVGAYAMFALGIVFIYRASRVLNIAHGAMAMFPAYIAYSLSGPLGVYVAAILGVAFGAGLGVGVEYAVVRRLRRAGPTAQTVGTVAVFGLLVAIATRLWGTTPITPPGVFPDRRFQVGDAALSLGGIGLFVVAGVVSAGFILLFGRTDIGLAMRGAADNRRAAALMGVNPDRTTQTAWLFAGLLAALGGILLGASSNLHPFNLALGAMLPGFVAALIGGLESERRALVGAGVVGLVIGIVPTLGGAGEQPGAPQLALTILALVVMSLRGQRISAGDVRSGL